MWDAVIIGSGPAGATIARLLAQWGYRVLIHERPADSRPRAESLPPSINHLFELLEIRDDIARAGFYPDGGNTSWWTSDSPRVEHFPAGATGYHVSRPEFDALLLRLAKAAGAEVTNEPFSNNPARFVIDCSGRTGVLAQAQRNIDQRYRTVSLCAQWVGEWDADATPRWWKLMKKDGRGPSQWHRARDI